MAIQKTAQVMKGGTAQVQEFARPKHVYLVAAVAPSIRRKPFKYAALARLKS